LWLTLSWPLCVLLSFAGDALEVILTSQGSSLPNVTDEPTGPASLDRWRSHEKGRTINPLALATGSPLGTGWLNRSRAVAYQTTEELTGQCRFPTTDPLSHSCSPEKFFDRVAATALRQHNRSRPLTRQIGQSS
jgi:hypothetical protein